MFFCSAMYYHKHIRAYSGYFEHSQSLLTAPSGALRRANSTCCWILRHQNPLALNVHYSWLMPSSSLSQLTHLASQMMAYAFHVAKTTPQLNPIVHAGRLLVESTVPCYSSEKVWFPGIASFRAEQRIKIFIDNMSRQLKEPSYVAWGHNKVLTFVNEKLHLWSPKTACGHVIMIS